MKSVCIRQSIWLAVHIKRAHICAINRIQCNCGAVYEVVDPKDRARDLNLFKCLVCGKEIISAKAYKVGDLHLIVRPKPDRDGKPLILFLNKAAILHSLSWGGNLLGRWRYLLVIAVKALLALVFNLKASTQRL